MNKDKLLLEVNKTICNNLKALEQEPKTGHWVEDKCSACGKGIEDLIDSCEWYRNEKPNFCPFCGLKLVDSDEEIKLGDEVVNEWGEKGVVVGIDTYEGEVMLSLLMRNHKVPQVVKALMYKTKTGRHFPQIIEVLEQMKAESEVEI